jgi:PAS domain S-box-containing protein
LENIVAIFSSAFRHPVKIIAGDSSRRKPVGPRAVFPTVDMPKLSDKTRREPHSHLSDQQFRELVEVISRSQQNFRDLIDHLDHAIFTLSLDGEIRVANRRMSEILGASFQELIGRRLGQFLAEPTAEELSRALPRFLKTGSWAGRVPIRLRRGGDRHYFDCWLQTVAEDGKAASVSGWARDVTSQHESELRFQELFESLREGIFFTTPDGRILDANPALVRMLGFDTREELQARNIRNLYLDPSQRDAIIRELEQRGSVEDREVILRRKDSATIHCLCSGFAIRDSFGQLVRMHGTFVDITERLEIEKRLHHEQEFVRHLITSFPDMIAVLDHDARFTFMSPRVQDVLGRSPEEFVGQPLGGSTHPDDRARLAETVQRVLSGQSSSAQVEYRAPHADGSWRMLRASAGPLFGAKGEITGVVASARDITESRQFENQLVQKEKFASMGQMMAGAAHELNNPLTAILGVSDLLRERATDDATRRQIEIVLQQARRAAAIVQNLLAFSRPAVIGRARVRVDEIIQRVLQQQDASLRQKAITVQFDNSGSLPSVEADPRLLTQVFLNIITNAEQAISSVRDHGTLKISAVPVTGNLSIAFVDDGPGISPEILGKIFDPFFTTKRPGGGSGLGLTISLAIVKEHGGRIEVQSSPSNGATVRVVLPVPVENLPVPEPHIATRPVSNVAPLLRGHSALIVDDEDSIREIVQEGLSARGMQVEGASSAEDALAHLAAHSYDVVLCDFNLPGLNGEQLFDRLRSQSHSSPPRFVFMTGDMLEPALVSSFNERGAHVLQKPFHIAALANLLTELLETQPVKSP